ncbi:GSCOCG00008148001-RA-CDS [Cotesia congregata]|nr:GSCOCG00008148001-RA-CDS [Cotesia congregata]
MWIIHFCFRITSYSFIVSFMSFFKFVFYFIKKKMRGHQINEIFQIQGQTSLFFLIQSKV